MNEWTAISMLTAPPRIVVEVFEGYHPNMSHQSPAADPTPMPRWRRILSSGWIPTLLLLVAGLLVLWVLALDSDERAMQQQKNLRTVQYAGIAIIGSFAWFVFFASVRLSIRLATLAAVVVGAGVLFAMYEIEGVDGDLRPIFRRRGTLTVEDVLRSQSLPSSTRSDVPAASMPAPQADAPTSKSTAPASPAIEPTAWSFPQFLGPDRSGKLSDLALMTDWQNHPPRLLWRRPLGPAWSGFAVQGRHAITQEQRDDQEMIISYDLHTGEPLWTHRTAARYDTVIAGIGPRATPTIDGDRVFAIGATGWLTCLDLETGAAIWQIDTLADTDASLPDWGIAGSPLVDGDRVIITTGGKAATTVAYHRDTGKRIWAAGTEATSYTSPAILTLLGTRQLVMQNQFTITGHALDDGHVLWSHSTPGAHPKVAQPVALADNQVLISSGYGTGSDAFELSRDGDGSITTKSIWKNVYLKAKFANFVVHEGHVYGLNDGTLTCLDVRDGARQWRGDKYGHGQLLLVGNLLLILAESGDVVLVEARPDEFNELTRFTAFTEKTWNSPALAGRFLVIRNDREAACFELPVRE